MATRYKLAVCCDGPQCDRIIAPHVPERDRYELAYLAGGSIVDLEAEMRRQAALKGWTRVSGRDLCPACSKLAERMGPGPRADQPTAGRALGGEDACRAIPRPGFTLVELLVVLVIVGFLAVVALPVVVESTRGRAVHSAADAITGALTAAREAALKDRAVKGLRITPEPSWGLSRAGDGRVDPSKALAGVRVVPMESAAGYGAGLVTIDLGPLPPGFVRPAVVLMLEQAPRDRDGLIAEPTAWAWNLRVGDRVRIGGSEADYWIVGPTFRGPAQGNVERFVNYGPAGPDLDRGDGDGPREYLYLVNGVDDDGDGWVDPGFNGVDDNLDGVIDDPAEWIEIERWHTPHAAGVDRDRYSVLRRLTPSQGAQVDLGAAAVDLTGWAGSNPPRSRVPVDPWTGAVELKVHPDGRVEPATVASSPAALGLRGDWIHLWIADRSDVWDSPRLDGRAWLLSIHGKTGRVVTAEIDPDDPTAAIREAEGRL